MFLDESEVTTNDGRVRAKLKLCAYTFSNHRASSRAQYLIAKVQRFDNDLTSIEVARVLP
jgi:hypothetical protein